jgi:ribosomal protein S18 acetylase RimI-like enzyme
MESWIETNCAVYMSRTAHNSNIVYRRAQPADRAFLAQTIIEADQSGTERSAYGVLLNLNRYELTSLFIQIFDLEIAGFEFDENSFIVAEKDGEPVGACATWVESADGVPSWNKRILCFRELLPANNYDHFRQLIEKGGGLLPPRSPRAAQLESVYVVEKCRGMGILSGMWSRQVADIQTSHPDVQAFQVITYANNDRAIHSYQKLGFVSRSKTSISAPELVDQLPFSEMVLMEKKV